jgi:hypothetical protein
MVLAERKTKVNNRQDKSDQWNCKCRTEVLAMLRKRWGDM